MPGNSELVIWFASAGRTPPMRAVPEVSAHTPWPLVRRAVPMALAVTTVSVEVPLSAMAAFG